MNVLGRVFPCGRTRHRFLAISLFATMAAAGASVQQAQETPPPTPAQIPEAQPAPPPQSPQTPKEKAWAILHGGIAERDTDKRMKAVHALGLLRRNREAEKLAKGALRDEKMNVRTAAATALGSMRAAHAGEELRNALEDSEPSVVLAAANSLFLLKDPAAYEVYYGILTGERKGGKGLIRGQMAILHDKKKMAQLGFEEGIGFIPFAGIGYSVLRTVMKDDTSPLRAAAGRKLARDPDPATGRALVKAAGDKNWVVRAGALEAVALRNDPALLNGITAGLDDEKDDVRFVAAACVIHLADLPSRRAAHKAKR